MTEKPVEDRVTRIVLGDDKCMPDSKLLECSCSVCGVQFQKGDAVIQGTATHGSVATSLVHERCFDQSKYGPQV